MYFVVAIKPDAEGGEASYASGATEVGSSTKPFVYLPKTPILGTAVFPDTTEEYAYRLYFLT